MSPVIDFSEVKGIEPVPAGQYLATIVHAENKTSNAGNEMINLRWKIEADSKEEGDGRIIFDAMVFTENALFRVKRTMQAIGFGKKFKGEVHPEDLLGKSALLTVDIQPSDQIDPETDEPYPPRNRVKNIKPI